jgi:TRAP-type mannitol/chloroaromatic compound transport system permease small subunit
MSSAINSISAQESVLYMHATLFMLAAGYTLLVDKHVRVDVFYAKVKPRPIRTADRHLLVICFC